MCELGASTGGKENTLDLFVVVVRCFVFVMHVVYVARWSWSSGEALLALSSWSLLAGRVARNGWKRETEREGETE